MYFTLSHEWVAVEDKVGRVGITSYVKEQLGEVVHIELPQLGVRVKAGDTVVILESTKAAVDIYTPVSGQIVAVNEALLASLSPLNEDPESSGWLFQLELDNIDETASLMEVDEYIKAFGDL